MSQYQTIFWRNQKMENITWADAHDAARFFAWIGETGVAQPIELRILEDDHARHKPKPA